MVSTIFAALTELAAVPAIVDAQNLIRPPEEMKTGKCRAKVAGTLATQR